MPKSTIVLLAGLVAASIALGAAAQEVSGIEISVRTRSAEEGRALAVRAAGDEAARRLGLDPASTVVTNSVVRNVRFADERLTALLDVTVEGGGGRRAAAGRSSAGRPVPDGGGWVLVVHAVRAPSGRLVPWDRSDPWGMIWRVPADLGRFRAVPVTGDAEDVSIATAQALESFDGRAFGHLADKYRAPAVALAVREGGEAAVAIWRNGRTTEWTRVPLGDLTDARAVRLAVTRSIAEEAGGWRPSTAEAASGEPGGLGSESVRISGWRTRADGGEEYKAVLSVDDRDDAVARLAAEGIEVLSLRDGAAGTEVVLRVLEGGIEAGLRRAGLRISP